MLENTTATNGSVATVVETHRQDETNVLGTQPLNRFNIPNPTDSSSTSSYSKDSLIDQLNEKIKNIQSNNINTPASSSPTSNTTSVSNNATLQYNYIPQSARSQITPSDTSSSSSSPEQNTQKKVDGLFQDINDIVKDLVSEEKELDLNSIGVNTKLKLNMRKKSPTELITPNVYSQLVKLSPEDEDHGDTSQSIKELIKYDVFYTLVGTITKSTENSKYLISILEKIGPLNECPAINKDSFTFKENINKTYNVLKDSPDILITQLSSQKIEYSGKTFQLCIKISNSETDNRNSTLMSMSIFNE
jgi:hypothetical protein